MYTRIHNTVMRATIRRTLCIATVFRRFGQTKFPDGETFGFRLEPIYTAAPAAFKNDAQFKSGQN